MSGVAVVTGASSGVGRAVARALAARGDAVGLIAREGDGLRAAVAEARAAGVPALALPADVADAAAVGVAAARAEAELGPIDVWFNDAMASVLAFAADLTADEIRRVTEVTYLGTVHGTLAALRRMRPRDRGAMSRWARRWPTARSPSRPPTAARRPRRAGSPTRCASS